MFLELPAGAGLVQQLLHGNIFSIIAHCSKDQDNLTEAIFAVYCSSLPYKEHREPLGILNLTNHILQLEKDNIHFIDLYNQRNSVNSTAMSELLMAGVVQVVRKVYPRLLFILK